LCLQSALPPFSEKITTKKLKSLKGAKMLAQRQVRLTQSDTKYRRGFGGTGSPKKKKNAAAYARKRPQAGST